jgi:hypothetical protein
MAATALQYEKIMRESGACPGEVRLAERTPSMAGNAAKE